MTWSVEIRATHANHCQPVERVIDACPAIIGRDPRLADCALEGDDSVSKAHASIDVRGDRLVVRDVRSTNGTFSASGRLETDRWVEVGPAEADNELHIGGWELHVRARRALPLGPPPSSGKGKPRSASSTVTEPLPFGASQSTTATGAEGGAGLLTSFASVADRLSEPVQVFRAAKTALDDAVGLAIAEVTERDRTALLGTLGLHYAEIRRELVVSPPAAADAAPERSLSNAVALAALSELAATFGGDAGALAKPSQVAAFKGKLRSVLDAFLNGLAQALTGVSTYVDEMSISPGASLGHLPRTAAELARAAFDPIASPDRGAEIVRRGFHELSIHQVASYNAILSGIRELLRELAPETIESSIAHDAAHGGFWRRMFARLFRGRRLLEAYRRRHRDLSTEEGARFALIFGPRFAEEYHAVVRETRAVPPLHGSGAAGNANAKGAPRGGTVPLAPVLTARGQRAQGPEGTVPLAPPLRAREGHRGEA